MMRLTASLLLISMLTGAAHAERGPTREPGGYHQHDPNFPKYIQPGCCGKDDCYEIPFENIELTRDGYRFADPDTGAKHDVPEEETQDSTDGKYWVCFLKTWSCNGQGCKVSKVEVRSILQGSKWRKCFYRPVNA